MRPRRPGCQTQAWRPSATPLAPQRASQAPKTGDVTRSVSEQHLASSAGSSVLHDGHSRRVASSQGACGRCIAARCSLDHAVRACFRAALRLWLGMCPPLAAPPLPVRAMYHGACACRLSVSRTCGVRGPRPRPRTPPRRVHVTSAGRATAGAAERRGAGGDEVRVRRGVARGVGPSAPGWVASSCCDGDVCRCSLRHSHHTHSTIHNTLPRENRSIHMPSR